MASLGCTIYTRKSSEEGLEQGFNSLDAQREACEAYILSQKSQGWKASSTRYDDGGFSGGNMNRPALQRLLADVQSGRVRIIVVYKVDRLTRSLADFAKLVELFDAHGVSFVSVTQQFNTTTSMGRLTLNVLLSFAQFEREVTGERIRDKIAASKRKGMWMGGMVPIGYRAEGRTLAVEEAQAERVREIFGLYLRLGCVSRLKEALDAKGWTTPLRQTNRAGAAGNRPFSRGHLYRILGNAIYAGRISHKGQVFEGEHPSIVDKAIWQQVRERLASNRQGARRRANADTSSLLTGLVFDAQGGRITPSHTAKGSKRYRYYAGPASKDGEAGTLRVPAQELDGAVVAALAAFLGDEARVLDAVGGSELHEVQRVLRAAKDLAAAVGDGAASQDRADAVHALVQRVIVHPSQLQIRLRAEAFDPGEETLDAERLSIEVPMQIKRAGKVSRLVVGGGATPIRRPDPKLIALVTKAQDWFERLRSGKSSSVDAIAQAEGVSGSYVTRLIYLAFLAPDIVDRIRSGEQPVELTVDRIQRLVPLPACWKAQRALLGIEG